MTATDGLTGPCIQWNRLISVVEEQVDLIRTAFSTSTREAATCPPGFSTPLGGCSPRRSPHPGHVNAMAASVGFSFRNSSSTRCAKAMFSSPTIRGRTGRRTISRS